MEYLGIANTYSGSNKLNGTVADVELLTTVWKSKVGNTVFEVKKDLSGSAMKKKISEFLTSGSAPKVLQYAGHGHYVADKNGDEADGRDETIVGNDLVNVTDDELRSLAEISPADFILVVSDSCHSGTIMDLEYQYNASNRAAFTNARRGHIIVSVSGCRDDQTSGETILEWGSSKTNGIMTYHFSEFIKSGKDITLKNIYESLLEVVNYGQQPVVSCNQLLDENFVLVKRCPPVREVVLQKSRSIVSTTSSVIVPVAFFAGAVVMSHYL